MATMHVDFACLRKLLLSRFYFCVPDVNEHGGGFLPDGFIDGDGHLGFGCEHFGDGSFFNYGMGSIGDGYGYGDARDIWFLAEHCGPRQTWLEDK